MKTAFLQIILVAFFPLISGAVQTVPEPQAFTGWHEVFGYRSSDLNLYTVKKIGLNCGKDSHLFPAHPSEETKLYHVFNSAGFINGKLSGTSEMCVRPSQYKNSRGILNCIRSETLYDVVISDTYVDACGNFYRGFFRRQYKKSDESMGTLFALGRTLYERPGSQFANDFIVGDSYAVESNQFMYLTALLPGDARKIAEARARVLNVTHHYNPVTHLYMTIK